MSATNRAFLLAIPIDLLEHVLSATHLGKGRLGLCAAAIGSAVCSREL